MVTLGAELTEEQKRCRDTPGYRCVGWNPLSYGPQREQAGIGTGAAVFGLFIVTVLYFSWTAR